MYNSTIHRVALIVTLFGYLLFHASTAFAAGDLCAAGWGTSGLNGDYTNVGTAYGSTLWSNGVYSLGSTGGGIPRWVFTIGDTGGSDRFYYQDPGDVSITPDAVPTEDWFVDSMGSSPIGTVTAGDCSPTPPPPATTTVYTVDNSNQDFFFGVIAFFGMFYGMIWLFRKRS